MIVWIEGILAIRSFIQKNLTNKISPKTRLISIVSKPIFIVVVVVVIDVVFIKKMLGPKKFG